ncbi:hypothetical protein [Xylella fastidiosa]|uniref:hypothetical protein n=1 Tax=Xylella fastidiosa TaxID=2371 RepID=UPI003AFA98FA
MQKPKFLASRLSKAKSKTNVGKFLILGLVLMAFLFMVAGLLFYQKYKLAHPSVKTPAKSDSLKPELASNNASLESDLIEKEKGRNQEEARGRTSSDQGDRKKLRHKRESKLKPWLLPMLQNAVKAILLKCSSKEINHHAHLRRWSGRWRAVCSWRKQAQSQKPTRRCQKIRLLQRKSSSNAKSRPAWRQWA